VVDQSPPSLGSRRPALASCERTAASIVGVALVGFVVHVMVNEVRGTAEYALTVAGLGALLVAMRTRPLPSSLALAAAASAVVHLAGGLIRVGDDVLYNTTPGPELLRYDHLGHALAISVGALLVWELFLRDACAFTGRGSLVVVTVLAALGLGAVNEAVEFVATLVHGGSHVGGYANTGWDLVTNTVAGAVAGVVILRRPGLLDRPPDDGRVSVPAPT
jgi:hypothetical protein